MEVLHRSTARIGVDPSDFLVLVITEKSVSEWMDLVGAGTNLNRVAILDIKRPSGSLVSCLADRQSSNLRIFHREPDTAPRQEIAIYDALPMLSHSLIADSLEWNYYRVFDDSFERGFPHITPFTASHLLASYCLHAPWLVVASNALYFVESDDGSFVPNQCKDKQGLRPKPSVYRPCR